jgi:hypothetical protein
MNAPAAPIPKPKRRRWKWTRRLALALVVLLVAAAGGVLLLYHLAGRDLERALAEADELDPGWRLEELEAKRGVIADEDNAALRVQAIGRLLPNSWPLWEDGPFNDRYALAKSLSELPPNQALTPAQERALNTALAAAAKAVAEARKLKDLPNGRYPVVRDAEGVPIPHGGMALRGAGEPLTYDVLLRAEEGDCDAAIASCRALVNVARSVGDEPNPFAQQLRLEMRGNALRMIERVLAQGEASKASLAALQKLLEDEETQPLFLHGARGLRVWMDELFVGILEERVKQWHPLVSWGFAVNVRPAMLHMNTRLVEAAKLPVEEQRQALDQGASPKNDEGPHLCRVFIVPKIQHTAYRLAQDQIRTQAELRCAIVALAAERHRLARHEWPASLKALVPTYLRAVPTGLFDAQPLRHRRLEDGLVIYCIGPDHTDDHGKLDRGTRSPAGTDLGVQLWNVDHRHITGTRP